MILHCMPPYALEIPNPAIGYLKGFLEAQGIPVKNIYWNAVLANTVLSFQRNIKEYTKESELNTDVSVVMFLSKYLLTDLKFSNKTRLDLYFSSILTNHEIYQTVKSVKDQIDQFITANSLHKAPLSGFTLKTYQWPMSFYVIRRLKALNPETKVVVGGITNAEQGRKFMEVFTQIDYAIWGEGEYPLYHLVNAVRDNSTHAEVPNLVYREGGTIVSTTTYDEYPPLDDYPFADHSDYFTFFKKLIPLQTPTLVPLWGSRSCPWNKCKFCVLNEEYPYRVRSPENMVEEIEYQSKTHGVSNFYFVDTELPGNKKRFKTLLHLIIKSMANRKKSYHFYGEISPAFIDDEVAQLLRIAPFVSMQIGFEAMTDSLLEKMQKRHRFAHNIQALKAGNHYSLNIRGLNIIRGIPTETTEDIIESYTNVRFLRFLMKRYSFHPSVLSLFKGSPFYSEMSEKERESWRENLYWEELIPTGLVPDGDRFEFFGFNADPPVHFLLWSSFGEVLDSYKNQERSYEWIEYAEGSFIEEKGPQTYLYTLDRDETDILIFCDSIKTFDELKKKFPHIGEDNLLGILHRLKEAGMVYYDAKMRTIISIVEAWKRKVT